MNELNKIVKFKRRTHRDNGNCNCVQTVDIRLIILVSRFVAIAMQTLMKKKLKITI